jgi:predicted nuclease of predicted toxin-antitoxin system
LPEKNKTTDKEVTRISLTESRVVITKDNDFLSSYIVKKEPRKLIIVSTGNVSNTDLLRLFEVNIEKMIDLLSQNEVIEINQGYLVVHY